MELDFGLCLVKPHCAPHPYGSDSGGRRGLDRQCPEWTYSPTRSHQFTVVGVVRCTSEDQSAPLLYSDGDSLRREDQDVWDFAVSVTYYYCLSCLSSPPQVCLMLCCGKSADQQFVVDSRDGSFGICCALD